MAFGLSGRNAGTNSIGSRATNTASNKAANIAIGSNGATVRDTSPTHSQRPLGSTKNAMHPGSKAGLNAEPVVHLQHGGTGYMNPSNQLARFSSRSKMPMPSIGEAPVRSIIRPKLIDSRLCKSATSSISRLKKLI